MHTRTTLWFLLGLSLHAGCTTKNDAPSSVPQGTASPTTGAPAPENLHSAKPAVKNIEGKLPGGSELPGPYDQVAYIAWGGDFPLLFGNGGETTREGTIFAKYNLKIKLVRGDDMSSQLTSYMQRKTHLLRGTHGMIAKHWQALCVQPELCPQWLLAETKSAGDHLYCRDTVKQVKDLKQCGERPCKIALQKDGPHEDFLLMILEEDAKTAWNSVERVWTKNLTGKTDSPDAIFRGDPNVDCAMGITPDMMAATGGVTSVGSGADNTIKGAHVVTSTMHRRESIVDLFAVSSEFVNTPAGKDWLHRFRAAYLESVEQLVVLRNAHEVGTSAEFESVMTAITQIMSDALPNMDETIGLYMDAGFLGHAGNVRFFDPSNAVGITYHNDWGNKLARMLATAQTETPMPVAPLDWNHTVYQHLKSTKLSDAPVLKLEATHAELEAMRETGTLGANVMVYHTALFGVDEVTITDFTPYHSAFDEILRDAQRYSHAPIVIRGHFDPSKMVVEIIKAGLRSGAIKQVGAPGAYRYYANGEELSLTSMGPWLRLIEKDPKALRDSQNIPIINYVSAAKEQSRLRVNALVNGLKAYAASKQIEIKNPIEIEAVGMSEPLVAKARSAEDAAANRRVEFSLVKTGGETMTTEDYVY